MSQSLMVITGELLDEDFEHNFNELCRYALVTADDIIAMVDEGLLEPQDAPIEYWHFTHRDLQRIRIVARLQTDLGVNLAGAALIIELLEQQKFYDQR